MFNLNVHVYSLPIRAARYNACGIRFRLGLRPAMIEPTEKPISHIEVAPARPGQESVMANLLELYAHDFSEFHDLEIGADGRFGYPSLPLYWSEPGRYPFLVKMDGKLAGLVLVKRGSEVSGNLAVWDMAEFFVLRG